MRFKGFVSYPVFVEADDWRAAQKQLSSQYGDTLETNHQGEVLIEEAALEETEEPLPVLTIIRHTLDTLGFDPDDEKFIRRKFSLETEHWQLNITFAGQDHYDVTRHWKKGT